MLPGVSPLFPQKPIINPAVPQMPSYSLGKHEIQYVNGQDGALGISMPPNSSDIFPDQSMSVIWVVTVDQTGNKTVKGFMVGDEYIPPKPVTMEDLMAEMREMKERLIRVEEGNNESDCKHAGTCKPVRANDAGSAEPAADVSK